MSNKKRIAIICPSLNHGGAEKVAADLSIYFADRGYDVFLFLQEMPVNGDYIYKGKSVQLSALSLKLSPKHLNQKLFCILHDICELRKLKKQYKITISISIMQWCNFLNILSKKNEKTILTIHSVTSKRTDFAKKIYNNKMVYRYLYQFADQIVFVSKYCFSDWKNHYGDFFNISKVIYNPSILYSDDTSKQIKGGKENIVVFVARLEGIKQPWYLIRMFSYVIKQVKNAKLVILGDGPLRQGLVDLVESLGLCHNIEFVGFTRKVGMYLEKAKVIINTSKSEAFPCSLIEAMQKGVPIIMNDCPGGCRELLQVENEISDTDGNVITKYGILTPRLRENCATTNELSKEEISMGEATVELLTNEKLRTKMSMACLERANDFDLDTIGKEWEKII